jgi:hypothetical protein
VFFGWHYALYRKTSHNTSGGWLVAKSSNIGFLAHLNASPWSETRLPTRLCQLDCMRSCPPCYHSLMWPQTVIACIACTTRRAVEEPCNIMQMFGDRSTIEKLSLLEHKDQGCGIIVVLVLDGWIAINSKWTVI